MSDLGNKEVMSRNLKRYIEISGKDRRELAKVFGVPYSTITTWINGERYPRIDKIEVMARYFGIKKSDLIEDKTAPDLPPPRDEGNTTPTHLTTREGRLITSYRALTDEGQDKTDAYVADLLDGKYRRT